MSRYLGPLWRKSRALHFSLLENKKEFSRGKKRTTPPGQHGGKKKRRLSTYGLQNQEKQKVSYLYGWREKQLYNLFAKSKEKKGNTHDNLLVGCESRLDNIVFRSGLVGTRRCARQWVSQEHFLVNGKKVKTPSYQVKIGESISLRKGKMAENKIIKSCLEQNIKTPPYINFDRQKLLITYLHHPVNKEGISVEWYNRKI